MTCTKNCKQDEGCECAIPKCEQALECKENRGTCVKNCKETDYVYCDNSCEPSNISSDKCMCKIQKTVECETNDKCTDAKGECVPKADCIAKLNDISCRDFCDKEECICEIQNGNNICVENACCTRNGGKCKIGCVDSDTVICEDWCDPTIDSTFKCMCEVQKSCVDSPKCSSANGACVPREDCIPSPTVRCDNLCQTRNFPGDPETCVCKIEEKPCVSSPDCKQEEGGTCKRKCVGSDTVICKDWCDPNNKSPDRCMCEVQKTCVDSPACIDANGACVPREDCTPSSTVKCNEKLCPTPNQVGDLEACVCKIEDTTPCVMTPDCEREGGTCKIGCEGSDTVSCKDLCDRDNESPDRCMCEVQKTCVDSRACINANGACVPREDCTTSSTVKCNAKLCLTSNQVGDPDACVCKIEDTTRESGLQTRGRHM